MTRPVRDITEFTRRELAFHKIAYDAGVLAALYDAFAFCRQFELHPRAWMVEATMKTLEQLFAGKLSQGRGRTGNARSKYRADLVHFTRWDMVKSLREHQKHYREQCEGLAKLGISDEKRRQVTADMLDAGRTWDDVYEHAAIQLEGTAAYGSPSTIKNSYLLVKKSNRDPKQDGRFYLVSHRTMTKLGIDV